LLSGHGVSKMGIDWFIWDETWRFDPLPIETAMVQKLRETRTETLAATGSRASGMYSVRVIHTFMEEIMVSLIRAQEFPAADLHQVDLAFCGQTIDSLGCRPDRTARLELITQRITRGASLGTVSVRPRGTWEAISAHQHSETRDHRRQKSPNNRH
jgi:hypothetical protein